MWIEGLIHNIQEVIPLEGGNEYKEGRALRRSYRGQRKVGQLYKHSWIAESDEAEDAEFEDIGDDEASPERPATPDSDDEV